MDKALREKILELFEYRRLPELIVYGGDKLETTYYERLIELQYQIYKLDHELETNWKVNEQIIQRRWDSIYKALDDLNIPKGAHDVYCRHIYKYQKHELDLRALKLPTRLSMEYFYFYKSCDVKLLRKIIYKNNPSLAKVIKESDWRLFDLVTEVNDDVTDLQEDIATINGNRFLISLKSFGKAKTIDIFTNFLHEIQKRNDEKVLDFVNLDINYWTSSQVDETIDLIHQQAEKYDVLNTSLYDRLISSLANATGLSS